MKKFKVSSEKITGGLLFGVGILQLVLSSKKDKHEREMMKTEIISEVVEELNKQ